MTTVPVIDTFTDKLGQHHSEIPGGSNQVQQSVLKDSGINQTAVIKKVDEALNLADASHLLEVTTENIQLRAQVLKLKKDSANLKLLSYRDNWLSFLYNPADSTVTDLVHNFAFSQVRFTKIRWFKPYPLIDFYADDPRVRITGATHFSVEVPPSTFGATADSRIIYDFKSGHVIPSVGLDFRVNKLEFTGREYWSVRNQKFQQQVGISYNQPIF